ncbi:MAG: PAS domain S-box protein [Calditrichaceae bacterium]|nr:PAS domain S-box protein [Calditrichaceae bacterium]MBN2708557.1 PAS domain S-box protein [Calditrichaceae bacterium]RQV96867.1 MAG: PAS domain S-box protein [Calditrichota bacterium]
MPASAKKNEDHYRLLFNSLNDAVFVNYITRDNTFSNFIEVNEVACNALAYSRDELFKRNLYMSLPRRDLNLIGSVIVELNQTGQAVFESFLLNRHRKPIPVEISAHRFIFNGKEAILSIARDITERKNTEDKLRASETRLRDLASRLQIIREEERTMIAREIHDELGQALSVLKIRVSLLAKKLKAKDKEISSQLDNLCGMIDQTVESVQKISSKLRPGLLDELGLTAALQWQAQEFEKETGIQCRYSLPQNDLSLDKDQITAIFRIFQEALTNVARHANAQKVSVYMKTENNYLSLEVTDNGNGITQQQIDNPKSLGLLGMRERAMILGGELSIYGVRGEGTNVKLLIPYQ